MEIGINWSNWPKLAQIQNRIFRTCAEYMHATHQVYMMKCGRILTPHTSLGNMAISHFCFVISCSLHSLHLRTCTRHMHTKEGVSRVQNGQLLRGTALPK